MCERQLTVQFACDLLEERDAVIAALRPLVAEGWRVDAFYSVGAPAQRQHMILGERMDVFEAADSRRVYTSRRRNVLGIGLLDTSTPPTSRHVGKNISPANGGKGDRRQ